MSPKLFPGCLCSQLVCKEADTHIHQKLQVHCHPARDEGGVTTGDMVACSRESMFRINRFRPQSLFFLSVCLSVLFLGITSQFSMGFQYPDMN